MYLTKVLEKDHDGWERKKKMSLLKEFFLVCDMREADLAFEHPGRWIWARRESDRTEVNDKYLSGMGEEYVQLWRLYGLGKSAVG